MAITITGSNGTFNIDFGDDPALSDFKIELKSKSSSDLLAMLKENKNIAEVQAILEELAARKIIDLEMGGTSEASRDAQRIKQLFLALMNGTISESGKEELAKLLGVDISTVNDAIETHGFEINRPNGRPITV